MVEIIEALDELQDVLDSLSGVGDIDVNIPDIDGDLALDMADGWRSALEKSYEMKNMINKFNDIRIQGETIVDSVGPATDNGVDPAPMKQAMFTFCDRGTQLVSETVNFAGLMMHLADIAGDLHRYYGIYKRDSTWMDFSIWVGDCSCSLYLIFPRATVEVKAGPIKGQ